MGIIFVVLGSLSYLMMVDGSDLKSITQAFRTNGLWTLIPITFVILGIYTIIYTIKKVFITKDKFSKLEVKQQSLLSDDVKKKVLKTTKNKNNSIVLFIIVLIILIINAVHYINIIISTFGMSDDITVRVIIIISLIIIITVALKSIIYFIINFNINKENQNISDKNVKLTNVLINLNNFMDKLYLIIFFTIWFGFLIIFDYIVLKKINDGGLILLLFSLIFWYAGFKTLYKSFIKK